MLGFYQSQAADGQDADGQDGDVQAAEGQAADDDRILVTVIRALCHRSAQENAANRCTPSRRTPRVIFDRSSFVNTPLTIGLRHLQRTDDAISLPEIIRPPIVSPLVHCDASEIVFEP